MPPIRTLDAQGLEVSAIGLGCIKMSHAYGASDERESVETIHRAIDHCRHADPRPLGGKFEANVRATADFRMLAATKGISPAQLALAWLLHKDLHVARIPGTRRRTFLEYNLRAVHVTLDADEVAAIDAALWLGCISGQRYGAAHRALLNG